MIFLNTLQNVILAIFTCILNQILQLIMYTVLQFYITLLSELQNVEVLLSDTLNYVSDSLADWCNVLHIFRFKFSYFIHSISVYYVWSLMFHAKLKFSRVSHHPCWSWWWVIKVWARTMNKSMDFFYNIPKTDDLIQLINIIQKDWIILTIYFFNTCKQ